MAPHSSTLAWKIPWTENPGGLQSMGSLRVRHDWATSLSLFAFMHWRRKWQPIPAHYSILAWRIPGTGEPGRLLSVGSHRVGHDWSDLAAAAVVSWTRNLSMGFDACTTGVRTCHSLVTVLNSQWSHLATGRQYGGGWGEPQSTTLGIAS